MTGSIQTRHAGTRDRRVFSTFDPRVGSDLARRELVDASIAARRCWIAERAGEVIGYGVTTKNFFNRDFIELVYIAESERRSGAGGALLSTIERSVRANRVFTCANDSNVPMRALLEKRGYKPSGRIENLDPGDPELVFVKFL